MKIEKYVNQCITHCQKFTNSWDYFCIASEAFLAGYRAAKEEANLSNLGKDIIEVSDQKDGMHQLSERTFRKHQESISKMPFKNLLTERLYMIDFSDIRVIEDRDCQISFQGIGTRKKL